MVSSTRNARIGDDVPELQVWNVIARNGACKLQKHFEFSYKQPSPIDPINNYSY
jgi:hypothetical protein